MSSIIHLISVENNIPLLCLGIHVGLPLFFFCQPHLLHLLSSMCSSTEPEDPPCRILKGRPYSMWSTALPGFYQAMSISFLSFCLLTCSHSLSSSPNFPKVLCSLILAVALPHQYYWFIPCHTLKLHFNISVGILEKWEVRTYWVCNLVLEIYNVLLYSEANSP